MTATQPTGAQIGDLDSAPEMSRSLDSLLKKESRVVTAESPEVD